MLAHVLVSTRWLVLAPCFVVVVFGCARSHNRDADPAAHTDAGRDASHALDAGVPDPPDAEAEDAFRPEDAGPPCVPAPEMCDGLDQDCDDRVDEDADDACDIERGTATCVDGACAVLACEAGFADCDADAASGCEQSTSTRQHCGGCGVECGVTEDCVDGLCEREEVVDIALNYHVSCALLASGRVLCWGSNVDGTLGEGGVLEESAVPVEVLGISDAIRLTAGGWTACVLHRGGTVSCWGGGPLGQRGDGTEVVAGPTPRPVLGLSGVVEVSMMRYRACALRDDGGVRCWGLLGATGEPVPVQRNSPVELAGLPAMARLHGGDSCSASAADGGVFGWNREGQHLPSSVNTHTAQVLPVLDGAAQVWTGQTGCATWPDGGLSCWGSNRYGLLQRPGLSEGRTYPIGPVEGLPPLVDVVVELGTVAVLTADGQVLRWGRVLREPTPLAGANDVRAIALGNRNFCVLMSRSRVSCLGFNEQGQVGDGTTEPRTELVPVMGFE